MEQKLSSNGMNGVSPAVGNGSNGVSPAVGNGSNGMKRVTITITEEQYEKLLEVARKRHVRTVSDVAYMLVMEEYDKILDRTTANVNGTGRPDQLVTDNTRAMTRAASDSGISNRAGGAV